jgi:hypothetical protein
MSFISAVAVLVVLVVVSVAVKKAAGARTLNVHM